MDLLLDLDQVPPQGDLLHVPYVPSPPDEHVSIPTLPLIILVEHVSDGEMPAPFLLSMQIEHTRVKAQSNIVQAPATNSVSIEFRRLCELMKPYIQVELLRCKLRQWLDQSFQLQ